MSISSVSLAAQAGSTVTLTANGTAAAGGAGTSASSAAAAGAAAVYEKSTDQETSGKTTYTRDTVTLSEISKQVEAKLATLRATVEKLITQQSIKSGAASGLSYDDIMEKYDGRLKEFYDDLEVDDDTRLKAQEDISEDGFWGVKQTAARAVDFAKALAGGDRSKLDALKQAIEEGYKAAEKAWGGELPEICQKTQAATLQGLDDWATEEAP